MHRKKEKGTLTPSTRGQCSPFLIVFYQCSLFFLINQCSFYLLSVFLRKVLLFI